MKRGIDVTTVVLVGFLLGILVLVGRVVNPPPAKGDHDHGHEGEGGSQAAPPPKPQSMPTKETAQPIKGQSPTATMPQGQEGMGKGMPPHPPSKPSVPPKGVRTSPAPDGMDPSLWQEHDMGTVTPTPDTKK